MTSQDALLAVKRLVACVQACERVPTDILEAAARGAPDAMEWFGGWADREAAIRHSDQMRAQRDLLADALRRALCAHSGDWQNGTGWEQMAKNALARVLD